MKRVWFGRGKQSQDCRRWAHFILFRQRKDTGGKEGEGNVEEKVVRVSEDWKYGAAHEAGRVSILNRRLPRFEANQGPRQDLCHSHAQRGRQSGYQWAVWAGIIQQDKESL